MPEPTSMTLATASRDGHPSARILLYKGLSDVTDGRRGLHFFTNYNSPKSLELEQNPRAAMVFHWVAMKRQVRFVGRVEKLSYEVSNHYFQSRPRGSQIGAWASPQSQKIEGREELIEAFRRFETQFSGQEVPCPKFWGGWRLVPDQAEFWQAAEFRLHDRCLYEWQNGSWRKSRLAP